MDYTSIKKLAEKYKIDFYQFISYLEYLSIPIESKDKTKVISNEHIQMIERLISLYDTNQIAYMKSHQIEPFFEGTLLLDLRKKYNLNEKQFRAKCPNIGLEFKYVYSDSECQQFDDYISNGTKNRADLREEKYIREGWIPLRKVIEEFGKEYQFSKNTALDMLRRLNIGVYKPIHQLSFINSEQKKQFENFLKQFNTPLERRLSLQEKTCIEKYGVVNPSLTEKSRDKISRKIRDMKEQRLQKSKKTCMEKYGVENIFQRKDIINKNKQNNRKEIDYIHSIGGILTRELSALFNKDYTTIVRLLDKLNIKQEYGIHYFIYEKDLKILDKYCDTTEFHSASHAEKDLVNFIKSIYPETIVENSKQIIPPLELDIFLPERHLAIEFNGVYWHNELRLSSSYHLNKTMECNKKGIDLIHVFEDDWNNKPEIIKSMIASRLGIYKEKYMARKLKLEEVSREEAKDFFDKNHIQGFAQGSKFFALFNEDKIIQCVCINQKGFHDGNIELTRMATKINTQVVGGFSKLVSYAYRYFGYKPIISYINRAWFNGKGYLNSGFKITGINPPSYYYVVNGRKIHKSHFRKNRIKNLYEKGELDFYDKTKTEHELMLENHIYRIYDCGTIKVQWDKFE